MCACSVIKKDIPSVSDRDHVPSPGSLLVPGVTGVMKGSADKE